ncbi:AraC family transcriptional regulator [Nitrospirillum iridis]|uniref:AraC-like DNA-binding protein n=1 Tax=Nitrospirillum iridis TaxID=765888 RepID=A0A7X0AWV5_9PROT|nr:AraC family transcriptional regulator [Nitrospirillum iridis]MBB6250146.1 AraC-like DNA-binding protein [Nitrospirillum iridis]
MPLDRHLAFRASTVDEAIGSAEARLGVRALRAPVPATPCATHASHRALPVGELWFCAYGFPVTLRFGEGDYFRVQVPHAGAGQTRVGGVQVSLTGTAGCISAAEAEIDFAADFQQMVWRVPIAALVRKLSTLTGDAVGTPLRFDASIDLASAGGAHLRGILSCLADVADGPQGPGAALVTAELEQALATSLLVACRHNHSHLLEGPVSGAAPWQVTRAEDYIEANADNPITLDDIVAATGASARSVFRAFAQYRDYTPMEFLKRTRLRRAHRLAESGGPLTVTEIALSCGYGDLSRFSKDFLTAFGETPSTVLRRHRGGVS